eukprot:RCo039125
MDMLLSAGPLLRLLAVYLFALGLSTVLGTRNQAGVLQTEQYVELQQPPVSGCDLNWDPHVGDPCTWVGMSCQPSPAPTTRLMSVNISAMGCVAFWESFVSYGRGLLEAYPDLNLISLDVSFNNFFGPVSLPQVPATLQWLSARSNPNLGSPVNFSALPVALRHLDLSLCYFSGPLDLSGLPPSLEFLRLSGNNFYGAVDLSRLPAGLQVLELRRTGISGVVDLDNLPPTLVHLDLSVNNLGGRLWFFKLPSGLRFLDLSMNAFEGNVNFTKLPPAMQTVRLSMCAQLNGFLDMAQLPEGLQELTVSSTSLSGAISFAGLPQGMQILSLSTNLLNGTADLTELPGSLLVLDLSDNEFHGSLDLRQLPRNLTTLLLQKNNFQGPVHLSLLPPSLTQLSLADNALVGLANLSTVSEAARLLDLSRNDFSLLVLSQGILDSAANTHNLNLAGNQWACPLPPLPIWMSLPCSGVSPIAVVGASLRSFASGVFSCVLSSWRKGYPCFSPWVGIACEDSEEAPEGVAVVRV